MRNTNKHLKAYKALLDKTYNKKNKTYNLNLPNESIDKIYNKETCDKAGLPYFKDFEDINTTLEETDKIVVTVLRGYYPIKDITNLSDEEVDFISMLLSDTTSDWGIVCDCEYNLYIRLHHFIKTKKKPKLPIKWNINIKYRK